MAVAVALYGLMAGVPACLMRRFEASAAIAAIERHKVSLVLGVPSMFIRLVNAAPARESLASVRTWVSASDFLPEVYRKRLLEYGALLGGPGRLRIGSVFINAYGMVELGGIAMFGVAAPFLPGGGEWCLPVSPFRVRVADAEGRTAPPEVTAECQVAGPLSRDGIGAIPPLDRNRSLPTAGCAPATWPPATGWGWCASPAAPRT